MKFDKRIIAAIIAILLLGAVAGGLWLGEDTIEAFAGELTDSEEDELEGEDVPITGEALEQASQAALDYAQENGMGEAEVSDTEVGDEEGYYEIELTLEDGREVDVHLDEDFNVLGQEDDGVGGDDD